MCPVSYRNCWIPRISTVFNVFLKKSSTSLTSVSIGVAKLTSFKSFLSSNRTTSMISFVMPFFFNSTAKQLELSSIRLNASFLKRSVPGKSSLRNKCAASCLDFRNFLNVDESPLLTTKGLFSNNESEFITCIPNTIESTVDWI